MSFTVEELELIVKALLRPSPSPSPSPSLRDWLNSYTINLKAQGFKDQTIRNRLVLLRHIDTMFGGEPLKTLTPIKISSALRERFPDKTSTALRVLHELKSVYAEAMANDLADRNPAALVKGFKHSVQRTRLTLETWLDIYYLSKEHRQKWIRCLLLLALMTGQRRGDLAKMKFSDIVTVGKREYLRVEQQKEAGKGYGARVEIPLNLKLNKLGVTLGMVIELCKKTGKPGATLLRKANGDPIEVSSLSARFAELCETVYATREEDPGPRRRPSLHEVRSLAARLFYKEGVDVQSLLGHKHAEMTSVYLDDRGLSAHEWKRVTST